MHELSDSLPALMALGFVLGLRHGLDPDHLAAIDAVAQSSAVRRPLLARLTGTLFSVGHGAVVVFVALLATSAVQQYQPPGWMTTLGAVISIASLLGLSLGTLASIWKEPPGARIAIGGPRSAILLRIFSAHSAVSVVGIGALFAISFDSLSLGVLFAGAAAKWGGLVRVLLPALSFVAGMATTDGLNGLLIAQLAARADLRAATASRLMAVAVAGMGIAVAALTLIRTASVAYDDWAENGWRTISLAVIAIPLTAFAVAMWLSRTRLPADAITCQIPRGRDTDGVA